jgi:MFS family permease
MLAAAPIRTWRQNTAGNNLLIKTPRAVMDTLPIVGSLVHAFTPDLYILVAGRVGVAAGIVLAYLTDGWLSQTDAWRWMLGASAMPGVVAVRRFAHRTGISKRGVSSPMAASSAATATCETSAMGSGRLRLSPICRFTLPQQKPPHVLLRSTVLSSHLSREPRDSGVHHCVR